MSINYQYNWREVPAEKAECFGTLLNNSSTVAPIATGMLPGNYSTMPGLQGAFYSGYAAPQVGDGVTGVGELVVIRHVGETGKAYARPIGVSGSGFFIGAQVKHFSGHHYLHPSGIPMDLLFGNVPWSTGSGIC